MTDAERVRRVVARRGQGWLYHLTHVEWLGTALYLRHIAAVTKATWYQDLRPVRALLSAISLAIGVFLILPGNTFATSPTYYYLDLWFRETVVGAMFIVHGIGLSWRNYSPSVSTAWAKVIGAIGILLYTGYPTALGLGLGRTNHDLYEMTGQGLALYILAFACAWVARRVGNGEDRSGA